MRPIRRVMRGCKMVLLAAAIAAAIGGAGIARATDVKIAGRLNPPHGAAIVPVCTDPIVQNVLSEDLRLAHRAGGAAAPVTLTVSVSQQVLAPGVSLTELFPGDPGMAAMLRAMGDNPPPLGDTGDQPLDPYARAARRQALNPDDPTTAAFRAYQEQKMAASGKNAPTHYDSLPKNEIYDTVIVARATLGSAPDELKAVAVVHSGESVRQAKELVAEDIANAVLR